MPSLEQSILEQWDQTFTEQLERVDALAGGLTAEQRSRRPAPEKWGVDHCLEHLTKTLTEYQPHLERGITKAEAKGGATKPEYRRGRFARWFFSFVEPGGRAVPAPKRFRPTDDPAPGAEDRFRTALADYRALLTRADRVNLNGTKFRSPVSPLLRFSIGEGFELMVIHQERHLLQAERARDEVLGSAEAGEATEKLS